MPQNRAEVVSMPYPLYRGNASHNGFASDRGGPEVTRSATRRHAPGVALIAFLAALLFAPASAPAGDEPNACFTQSPAGSVPTGQAVTFDSSCSGPQGQIAGRAWDLDNDGQFDDSNETTATRSFATPGKYTIRLRVVSADGEDDTETRTVTVTNRAPTASFGESPSNPVAGQDVTFTSTSSDPDGSIVRQRWALDADGAFDDGTGTSVTRAFSEPGTYSVKLEVTDNNGATATVTRTITVSAPLPPPSSPAGQPPVAPVAPLRFLDPFPVVRLRGRTTARGVRLSLFTVRAPHGSRVEIRCGGTGCPAGLERKTVRTATGRGSRTIHLSRFERFLKAGTVLRVAVTQTGMVGKYTRIRIRRIALPIRTDRCLLPDTGRPVACPRSR